HLALVGRSGEQKLSSASRAALESLRESGVNVVSFAADISTASEVAAMMGRIRAEMPPLRGVIHAAGVLDDGILLQQTAQRIHTTFAPKAGGAWNLHCQTDGQPLDFFILFSSVTAPFGSPGQGNYAAANAYLDGLAQQRKAAGLPALSINWGPWGQIGLAAQRHEGGLQGLTGLSMLDPQDGLAVFGHLLAYPGAQVIATGLNAAKWVESHPAASRSSLFAALAALAAQSAATAEESSQRAKILAAEPGRNRRAVLEEFVQGQAAVVLRLPPARVDVLKPLRSLGMDSLMGIEFRNRLESSLDVTLSATLVWNYPTVNDLVPFLAEKMGITLEETAPATPAEVPAAREPELSADIENLSDDDLAALLDEELKGLDDLL
ncbi:MAG TPA: beta-ketoacyl reductase, partial [Anaerolineaceae bacterium]